MQKMLVTGSSGLIGSEIVSQFCHEGWSVYGIDNNMRQDFFGPEGDTRWNQKRLQELHPNFNHIELDIRNREEIFQVFSDIKPDVIVHAAAQPSHDLAATRVFDDFETNALGTLNLLEASRRTSEDSIFIYLSTNKVYGDAPNMLKLVETETRYDYADPEFHNGISETFTVDQSKHSLFGASKLSADILVQEYGRYFGLYTCCLRGGCLTGPNHSGVQLHGFLSYLIRCNIEQKKYTIFGYKGKQVRDNIHAVDIARFIQYFIENPRKGEVYNIGGGRDNSVSILEAFSLAEKTTGIEMQSSYVPENRVGDHICYISDLSKIKAHYPLWNLTRNLEDIFSEIAQSIGSRLKIKGGER